MPEGKRRKQGIAQVCPPCPQVCTGEPQLPVTNFLGYNTCTHNLYRLKFSVFQLGQPDLYILWGDFGSRTAGVLCVLTEFKCFQWQPTRGRWFQGVKFE